MDWDAPRLRGDVTRDGEEWAAWRKRPPWRGRKKPTTDDSTVVKVFQAKNRENSGAAVSDAFRVITILGIVEERSKKHGARRNAKIGMEPKS